MSSEPEVHDASVPPFVLLHGLGANRQAFQRFVRVLPDAWEKHPLDLLGHGDAEKPESGYALEDYARYLVQQLAELGLAGDRAPIVLGHSLGAAVAVACAADYPGVCRGLVLLDPPRGHGEATKRMLQAKLDGRVDETVHDLFADQSLPLRQWTIGTWNEMAPGVARELNSDWKRFAARVDVPVVVVHGDADQGSSGVGAEREFARAIAEHVDGAGHYLHATHARETAAAVERAVSRLVTGAIAAGGS